MELIPLSQVFQTLKVGMQLPWDVLDDKGNLLLSKGFLLSSDSVLNRLVHRGLFVNSKDIQALNKNKVETLPPTFFDKYIFFEKKLSTLLKHPLATEDFEQNIKIIGNNLFEFAGSYSSPLLFSAIYDGAKGLSDYGISHPLHAASIVALLCKKMDWPNESKLSLVYAALTMNISMTNLHSALAKQTTPLTPEQRKIIDNHTIEGTSLLRQLGVTDTLWLTIVEQHHEQPNGKGYPIKMEKPIYEAQVLQLVDVFLAKHSPRVGRTPMPAKEAAQKLYMESNSHPVASMIIKELGIYPPGCFVKLANGEIALVLRKGASPNTPKVISLMNKNGEPILSMIQRDTSISQFAIVSTVPNDVVRVIVSPEQIFNNF